jgi:hypothetical protein
MSPPKLSVVPESSLNDAINMADFNKKAMTPERQYWEMGSRSGNLSGTLAPRFLTFYANLFAEVGVTIKWIDTDEDDRDELKKIQDWLSSELLPAIRDARIEMLRTGWGAVMLVPESSGQQIDRWRVDAILGAEHYERLWQPPTVSDRLDGVASPMEPGLIRPEYLIQAELVRGIGVASPAPLKTFQDLLVKYDKKGETIDNLIRTISLLVIQEPGWNEILTKAYADGDEKILGLVKKKVEHYQQMESAGLAIADTSAQISIETRNLAGVMDSKKDDAHRITSEADGIPEEILWNRSDKSGGLNVTDSSGLRVEEQLRSIFSYFAADISRWIALQLEAIGLNEIKFELIRGVYKTESAAERSARLDLDAHRRSQDVSSLISLLNLGLISTEDAGAIAQKMLNELKDL